jgi:hypothetical protein
MSNYWVVDYELWPTYDPDEGDLGRHSETETHEASSEIGAINAAMYYVRGRKSNFEMAYINEVHGPYESADMAREIQYNPEVKTLVEQMEDAT